MTIPISLSPPFRSAVPEDARLLAEGVNHAGEGMAYHLWAKAAAPGVDPWSIGMARARREEGSFSYRNAIVIDHNGKAAGCLIGYPIPTHPDPIPDDMPAMFRPLQELENLAPNTWYVNVVSVSPSCRSLGLGTKLMNLAEKIGRASKAQGLSLVVSDGNPGAMRLYRRLGFSEQARRPIVKEDWLHKGRDWVLLSKPI